MIVKFEIILNYQKEDLEFMFRLSSQLIGANQIQIQFGDQYYFYYYLSDLQIYQGGYYFINHENNNPCFIFINKSNFKCIVPKRGFAIKNDQAIPLSDCTLGEDGQSPVLFYNPYTMKCQNSHKIIPNCLQMDYTDINRCSKCWDQIYIYGQKQQLQMCCRYLQFRVVCSKICKSCLSHENNCLQCLEQSLLPPSCNCLLSNQFRNNFSLCQDCDQQGDSCFLNSNTCTSCGQGRINPPFCDCPLGFFEDPNIQNQEFCLKCLRIDHIFSFSFVEISSDYYEITSYSIPKKDQITLTIELKKELSCIESDLFNKALLFLHWTIFYFLKTLN
ncbi:hypothetical protein ABPG72_020156 [Tetrahymena utriculariae]